MKTEKIKNTLYTILLLLLTSYLYGQEVSQIKTLSSKYYAAESAKNTLESSVFAIELAQVYLQQNDLNNAALFYKRALKADSLLAPATVAECYEKIGDIYTHTKGKQDEAVEYYEKAAKILSKEKTNLTQYAKVLYKTATIFMQNKDNKNAVNFFEQAHKLFAENNEYEMSLNCAKNLASLYERQNEKGNAIFYRQLAERLAPEVEKYQQIKDSIEFSTNKTYADNELKKKEQTIKEILKDQDLHKSNTEKQTITINLEKEKFEKQRLLWIASSVGALLIAITIFTLSRYILRAKKQNIEVAQYKKEIIALKQALDHQTKQNNAAWQLLYPAKIAEEIKTVGRVTPLFYENALVIYIEIQGITQFADRYIPAQIINEMSFCFDIFEEITDKYRLEKVRTGAIGFLAYHLSATQATATAALHAALEIAQTMDIYRAEKENKSENFAQIKIGIDINNAVTGVVGKKRQHYAIIGNAVVNAINIANGGAIRKVNISEKVKLLAGDSVEYTPYKSDSLSEIIYIVNEKRKNIQ
jgi:tetratricopeptide (TPR) repeat protein